MSVPVVGGQALIEGVMMQNGGRVAIAVRRVEDGEIIVQDLPARGRFTRASRIPLLRGLFRLYDMLSLGIRALNLSASSTLTFLAAILIAVGGFIVLPLYLASIIPGLHEGNSIILNLVEGAIRISFFLLYLVGISRMKEIRRVFQYHGAEHKTVYAYEAGEDLTIMNAQKHTTLHPRCGTAFLVIVLIISILIFSLAGTPALWVRILLRLLLLPVVAGVSYELLRFSGRNYDRLWVKVLIKPGLWMQRLTTAEPSDDMVEVAIASLKRVTLPPPEQPAPPSL